METWRRDELRRISIPIGSSGGSCPNPGRGIFGVAKLRGLCATKSEKRLIEVEESMFDLVRETLEKESRGQQLTLPTAAFATFIGSRGHLPTL